MASFYESEACFRRYENHITDACLTFPKEVFFRTEGLRLTTDSARCRDTITAFQTTKRETRIDPVAYAPVLRELTISPFMDYVVITSKTKQKLLRKLWNSERSLDKVCIADCPADTLFHAQRCFESEFKRALAKFPQQNSKSSYAEDYVEPAPLITQSEFQQYDIEQAVDAINSGDVSLRYICPWDEETEFRVRNAIGDKLNVAYVVDKAMKTINIF